jgi:hypothetical protein
MVQTGHGQDRHLADFRSGRHHSSVEDAEATQLLLEAVFDIRAAVYEIHDVLIESPEDDDEASEEEDT